MSKISTDRLAVLIDADNAQSTVASELLTEIGRYGTATVRRAYGDWTTQNLTGWKGHLHTLAIQPIQQFRWTAGKNSTDSALIIDAMDLLHGNRIDGFCIVSSDSDFTRLATRIREAGLKVYGFGENKTPKPFVAACNKFVFTEILKGSTDSQIPSSEGMVPLKDVLMMAVAAAANDDGWASLGAVGNHVSKANPEFDARNYGKKKLSELVRVQDYLEVTPKQPADGLPGAPIYLRIMER